MVELCYSLVFCLSFPNLLFSILFYDSGAGPLQGTSFFASCSPLRLLVATTRVKLPDWRKEGPAYFLFSPCAYHCTTWWFFTWAVAVPSGSRWSQAAAVPAVRASLIYSPTESRTCWLVLLSYNAGSQLYGWIPSPEVLNNWQTASLPQRYDS